MNPNDKIFSEQIRRRIALERYSDQQADDLLKFLQEVRRDVVSKLAKAGEVSGYTQRQQKLLLDSIDRAHTDIYSRMQKEIESAQKTLAGEEAAAQAKTLRGSTVATVRELSIDQAYAVAKARPMQGRFLEDWLTDLEPSHRERLNAALRISFIEGESQSAAYRRISETLGRSGNGLRALIRTSNSHIASSVHHASYEANSDLVAEYEWRSTLDSRTTPICQTRDGMRYKVGEGPLPPAHVSCRSTTTGILKDHPPPERKTYKQWLAEQSADIQDEALGSKKRGDAYRRGEGSSSFRPPAPVKPKKVRPPPIPPPPKLPETPSHSFTRKEHADVLDRARKEAQTFAKKVLDKLAVGPMDGPNVKPSGAYFSPFRNLVYMPKKYATGSRGQSVMMHEQGHAIDFAKTKQFGIPRSADFAAEAGEDLAEMSAQRRLSEMNPARPLKKLNAAQKQAAKDLTPTAEESFVSRYYTAERQAELKAQMEKALASGDPNDLVDVILRIGRIDDYGSQKAYEWALFSDYLEAITKARWGQGHGAGYYKQFQSVGGGYTTGNTTEAFANAFALMGGPNGKSWKTVFMRISPNFANRVLKMLAEDIAG